MFLKRALYTWRNWKVIVAQFLVPLVFTVLALVVARALPGHGDSAPLDLALSRYGPTVVPVAGTNSEPAPATLAAMYAGQLMQQEGHAEDVSGEQSYGSLLVV